MFGLLRMAFFVSPATSLLGIAAGIASACYVSIHTLLTICLALIIAVPFYIGARSSTGYTGSCNGALSAFFGLVDGVAPFAMFFLSSWITKLVMFLIGQGRIL